MNKILFPLIWLFCAAPVHADSMQDPMRPPSVMAASGATSAVATEVPQVEAVKIAGRQRLAVLGGQTVREGDNWQDGKISRITDTGVWVTRPSGREFLSLFPAAEKKVQQKR